MPERSRESRRSGEARARAVPRVETGREDLARRVEALVRADPRPEAVFDGLRGMYLRGDVDVRDLAVVEAMLEGFGGETPSRPEAPSRPSLLPSHAGTEMDAEVRRPLERIFATDLSGVRVHAGDEATALARAAGAEALSFGREIVVADPAGARDLPLMAHEAAHVLSAPGAVALKPDPDAEKDDESVAEEPEGEEQEEEKPEYVLKKGRKKGTVAVLTVDVKNPVEELKKEGVLTRRGEKAASELHYDHWDERSKVVQAWLKKEVPGKDTLKSVIDARHKKYLEYVKKAGKGEDTGIVPVPQSVSNAEAREVDLGVTGVEVRTTGLNGKGLPRGGIIGPMRLDPVFAVLMVRFLKELKAAGVTVLYTGGFLRSPIDAGDPHPLGMAVDITGFKLASGETLLLRRGQFVQKASKKFAAEHSDWFDEEDRLKDGRTHRQAMLDFAGIMRRYFGLIVGPGANAQHMDHFHCQSAGYGWKTQKGQLKGNYGVHLPGTPENPRPFDTKGKKGAKSAKKG